MTESAQSDAHDALLAQIEERRNDAEFMGRLQRMLTEHKPTLDGLASCPRCGDPGFVNEVDAGRRYCGNPGCVYTEPLDG